MTVEDCLALGSHFYTFLHLQATLNCLVNEHYAGRLFIQIPRPLAPSVLGEMMKVIYEWYEFHSNENSLGEDPPCPLLFYALAETMQITRTHQTPGEYRVGILFIYCMS